MDIKGVFTKIVKYIVTTLLGTITDTVVLWCLAHYVFGDSHFEQYIVSPCISFECAVFVNYLTAYFYVWKDRITGRNPVCSLAISGNTISPAFPLSYSKC